ncbi:hypothetical protein ABTX71_01650 [Streptomyces parvulus]|uniref:hypothetical protein n=1 Tax=Streptomyces parvulus TaxID=146923 RepID=UPI0033265F89
MHARTATAAVLAALALTLTACSSEEEPTVANKPSSQAPTVSDADKAKAREDAGLPPEPSTEARKAFLDALNAIDSRIIKPGKEDQAVSRGLNQCSVIKNSPDDKAKLAESALGRFTIDTRLPEINTQETGEKIVAAVRKHLCPDF